MGDPVRDRVFLCAKQLMLWSFLFKSGVHHKLNAFGIAHDAEEYNGFR